MMTQCKRDPVIDMPRSRKAGRANKHNCNEGGSSDRNLCMHSLRPHHKILCILTPLSLVGFHLQHTLTCSTHSYAAKSHHFRTRGFLAFSSAPRLLTCRLIISTGKILMLCSIWSCGEVACGANGGVDCSSHHGHAGLVSAMPY
jgi:hypothetical protein